MKNFLLLVLLCFCCSCSAVQPTMTTDIPQEPIKQEQISEPAKASGAEAIFLDEENQNWLWMLAYLAAAFAGGWYFAKTGKRSETLTEIEKAAEKRLPLKQNIIAKITQCFFRRKKR